MLTSGLARSAEIDLDREDDGALFTRSYRLVDDPGGCKLAGGGCEVESGAARRRVPA